MYFTNPYVVNLIQFDCFLSIPIHSVKSASTWGHLGPVVICLLVSNINHLMVRGLIKAIFLFSQWEIHHLWKLYGIFLVVVGTNGQQTKMILLYYIIFRRGHDES